MILLWCVRKDFHEDWRRWIVLMKKKRLWNTDILELPPYAVAVTTTMTIPLLVGNPYEPSFGTVTGWAVDQSNTHSPKIEFHWMQWTPFWSFLRKQFRCLATAQLLDPYPNCAEAWSFLRKNGKILRPGNSFGKWLRQIPHIEVGEAWHMWFFHDSDWVLGKCWKDFQVISCGCPYRREEAGVDSHFQY